jgi:hypothetical protein
MLVNPYTLAVTGEITLSWHAVVQIPNVVRSLTLSCNGENAARDAVPCSDELSFPLPAFLSGYSVLSRTALAALTPESASTLHPSFVNVFSSALTAYNTCISSDVLLM